jgi:hypothetical protein
MWLLSKIKTLFQPTWKYRPSMSISQIYDQYYFGKDVDISHVSLAFGLVSENLGILKTHIRPDDRLHEDLARQSIITPKLENLSDAVLQVAPELIHEIDLLQIKTVDDLVRLIAGKVDVGDKEPQPENGHRFKE